MTIKYRCGKCLMGFREEHLKVPETGEISRCPNCCLRFRATLTDPIATVWVQPREAESKGLREVKCADTLALRAARKGA